MDRGSCWKSAVQEPRPTDLHTTEPPRWNRGTWEPHGGGLANFCELIGPFVWMNLRRNQTYCVQRDWETQRCASTIRLCGVDIIPDLQKRNQECYNRRHQVWRRVRVR